jgi:hypothetical protein
MTRINAAEFPPIGHPKSSSDGWDLTEIFTLLFTEPPKESKVCRVMVVCRLREFMNVVGKAFPFHMICDCGVKPLPSAVS